MESYQDMRKRQRAETDAFPLGAAITQESFDEMMRKWGLDPRKDLDKICRVSNIVFCQKKDLPALKEMLNRHIVEIEEGKKNPQFLYEMFYQELAETEFGYDGDSSRALDNLGYTYEQIESSPELKEAFEKAKEAIRNWED